LNFIAKNHPETGPAVMFILFFSTGHKKIPAIMGITLRKFEKTGGANLSGLSLLMKFGRGTRRAYGFSAG
jgi:hypothetical protein